MILSLSLYVIGVTGIVLNRRHVLVTILALELCLLAVSLAMMVTSGAYNDVNGLTAGLLILTIAGAETAIGLALIVSQYRNFAVLRL